MSKIESFNLINVKQFRLELEKTLAELSAKYGLVASSLGNIGYDANSMHTSKLVFATANSQTPVEANFDSLSALIGNRYKAGGRIFTINSVNPDNTVSATTNRGKRFKLTIANIKSMIQI